MEENSTHALGTTQDTRAVEREQVSNHSTGVPFFSQFEPLYKYLQQNAKMTQLITQTGSVLTAQTPLYVPPPNATPRSSSPAPTTATASTKASSATDTGPLYGFYVVNHHEFQLLYYKLFPIPF